VKVRIGILGPCPPPYGGVTRVIENNTRFWKTKNVESYLLSHDIPEVPKPPSGVELVDWRQNVSLNKKFFKIVSESLRFPKIRRSYSFLKYNLSLYNVLEKLDVDLLYSHSALFEGWSSVCQSRLRDIPTVLVSYGETWMETEEHKRLCSMQKFVLKKANLVVSPSEHCRRGAINLGAEPSKTRVVYSGIDVNKFSPNSKRGILRKKHQIDDDKLVISTLGLMLRRKMDIFLECLPFLKKFEKHIKVLIGGTGKDFEYFKALLNREGLPFVKLLGFVPEEELPSFYNATDIFVVAQHTKTECMGLSMKEAMACGVPVIGPDIGGVPEAIANGETGLLFSTGNAKDLATKIEMLINNENLRKRLGERAREVAMEKFDAEACAEENLRIFEEVLEGKRY